MRYLLVLSMCLLASCALFKGSSGQKGTTASVAGTSWTLESLAGYDKEATARPVMLIFEEDGKMHGNTGCNTMGGSYTIQGDSISFSQIITTKMACQPGMETESRLLQALNTANQYVLSAEHFYLKKDGTILATFRKVKKEE